MNSPFEFCLRLGDSDLILSQRLGAWCGHGPALEEDLALTNVALDLLGQARLWLTLAGEREGGGRDEDQFAYLRDAGEFRNLLLTEQPNGDYAHTMARQFFFDAWHLPLLETLAASSDAAVAAIAAKAACEAAYHLRRSRDLIVRLGDGTAESHQRVQAAVAALWPYTGEMFAADEVDRSVVDLEALRPRWQQEVETTFARATLAVPA
ncbi:MAG: 1,2-phenylacetyl-CoA epoxidase subunit PaaC, partial [Terriglobales bacterium]